LAAVAKRQKQVRQARLDERAAQIRAQVEAERRRTYLVIAVFAMLIIGGAGVLYFLTNPPNFGAPVKVATPKAVGPAFAVPDEGRSHVVRPTTVIYKHQPPSSGNHYSDTLAPRPWGTNHDAILAEEYVHNLEHGGEVLLYKCSGSECDTFYTQAQQLFGQLPKEPKYNEVKFLSTPYQNMSPKFALVAWDHEQDFTGFPTTADATAFYIKFVDQGPEAFS
jgi:hypothetical protein